MDILKTGANVFLTGEPGAGKTHTVNRYVAYLREHGIEPAITASTGIAATHIGGMTIHSWSGIGVASSLSPHDLERIAGNERVHRRINKAKVLIIDEISMLDGRTLGMVDQACRAVRRSGAAFGGLQVVLVGDFFQLPPVTREGAIDYAFRSSAWEWLRPAVCYLTEQHRQDDREFLALLAAIRAGEVGDGHLETLRERLTAPEGAPEDVVKLFSHNADVDRINDRELAKIPGDAASFLMRTSGAERLVEALLRGCTSPELLKVKKDAAVMFTRNDPERRFVNGTLGTVSGFAASGNPVVRTRGGAEVEATPMEWVIEDQGRPLAAVQQVPLRLAWAMTIHKSQGMSLDAAIVDLGAAFEYGQGYVALSRVRRLSGLYLLGCNRKATQVHPEVLAQDAAFRAASEASAAHMVSRSPAARAAAEHNFIAACGGRAARKSATGEAVAVADADGSQAKAYARWTSEEEKTLAALFRAGLPVKEIARRLDRQRGGIASRLKKLGLTAR